MKIKTLFIMLSLLVGANAWGQSRINTKNLDKRIDDLVTMKVKQLDVPGYSLAVYYRGEKIIQKGYGFADIEKGIEVTPETVFGLASVTKTFTGLALLVLVDEGKVKLDDPISRYYEGLSPQYQEITVQQLAAMSAGIPHTINDRVTWQEQIKLAQSMPLESKPGTTFLYSNVSFRMIGGIIEKASGQSYMDFLRARVLEPLGMTHTAPTNTTFDVTLATPYNEQGKSIPAGYKNPAVNFSAGMLASNTIDLVKYAQGLIDGKILTKNGFDQLWFTREGLVDGKKVKPSSWAFGWGSTQVKGHIKVGMNGGLPGVASTIFIYPEDNLIIIGLSNKPQSGHQITQAVEGEVFDR